jgi:hypothetical protein
MAPSEYDLYGYHYFIMQYPVFPDLGVCPECDIVVSFEDENPFRPFRLPIYSAPFIGKPFKPPTY